MLKNQTVRNIVKAKFGDDESAAELFKRMVEEYNATLLSDEKNNDET